MPKFIHNNSFIFLNLILAGSVLCNVSVCFELRNINNCLTFDLSDLSANFINSVKLCLWLTLHYMDLLVNSANVLRELLSVFVWKHHFKTIQTHFSHRELQYEELKAACNRPATRFTSTSEHDPSFTQIICS